MGKGGSKGDAGPGHGVKRKRAAGGANSRSRYGFFSANVTIYSGILLSCLGLAMIMSSSNGLSPWLHECWEHVELLKNPSATISPTSTDFGCKRVLTIFEIAIGFYSLLIGLVISVMENFTGWERSGTPVDFNRSILYLALALPCFCTMTTLAGGIFIYVACSINYFATFYKKEIFVNDTKRPKRVRLCPPVSLCECSLKPASREMSDNERLFHFYD